MLVEHLAVIFPEKGDEPTTGGQQALVEWDKEQEYQASNLVVYLQLDNSQEVKSQEEWFIGGLEYNVIVEGGSIDFMKYALKNILSSSSTATGAIAGYKQDMIDELTVEQVIQISKQREENHMKRLKTVYDAATGQRPALKYLEIHLGCTMQMMLTAGGRRNVLPRGILSLIVFPRGSKAHKKFLKTNAAENLAIEVLNPY